MSTDIKKRVLEISRGGTHNGPGFRTLILFKGCSLRCEWCSTPDSQAADAEIGFFQNRCCSCGKCVPVCPEKALELRDGLLALNRERCTGCGICVSVCHYRALKMYGKEMSVDALIDVIRRDAVLYRYSGGGVTLSGGEPLLTQLSYTIELMRRCRESGIEVGIQTAGHVPWKHVEAVLPYTAFFLWDIKQMDSQKHCRYTGQGNELILSNLKKTARSGVPIYIRIPIIPGYTDTADNIREICRMAQSLDGIEAIDILPFHHMGITRYQSLGKKDPTETLPLVPEEKISELSEIVRSFGFRCRVGG